MADRSWHAEGAYDEELEIQGGERHVGAWTVRVNQVGRLFVEQKGIDVEVRLFEADSGEPVRIADGMNGERGTERIFVAPSEDTQYRVEISAPYEGAAPARYRLRCEAHPAKDADRAVAIADERFDQGERHRRGQILEAAIPAYAEALEKFALAADGQGRWDCLQRLGWAHEKLGRLSEARRYYEELLAVSRELNNRTEEGNTLNRLGRVALGQRNAAEAERLFNEALGISEAEKDLVLRSRALNNLASLAYRQEDLVTALERFTDLRKTWKELGNPIEEATTLYNLSRTLQLQGRYRDSVDALKDALELYKRRENAEGIVRVLLQLGDVHRLMGELPTAAQYFEEVLAKDPQPLSEADRLLLHSQLGLMRAESGKPQAAAEDFVRVIEESKRLQQDRFEAMASLNLGALRRDEGRTEESLALLERARALFTALDEPRYLAACSLLEGLNLRDQGKRRPALARLEAAVREVEALRLRHEGWALRMAFFATRQTYYDELTDFLVELHDSTGDAYYLEQAFQTGERRRARSLLDALAEGRLHFRGEPALLDQERRLTEELATIGQALRAEDPSERESLEGRRSALLLRLETTRAAIRRSSPQYADLTRYEPLTADAIRTEVLDAETRLVAYSLGEQKSYLFTLTRDHPLEVFVLPGRRRIHDAVQRAREAFASVSEHRWPRHRRVLQELSDLVLGPLASALDDRRLAVIPDGALQTVPFAALLEPSGLQPEEQRPRWMLEGREVVHLPSASTLAALRKESQDRSPARYEIAVFADAVFSAEDERLESRYRRAGSEQESTTGDLARALRGPELRVALRRLPNTRKELEAIRDLATPARSLFIQDFQASRQFFEDAEIEQFQILHFATHGLLHPRHPELSGLVLSLVDEKGRPVDGFLRAHELYSRQLGADLVVLSACETGLGQEVRGEGVIGLPRGFLYAGVPRVVVSLWNVDDASTASLMTDFYRHLSDGQSPAAALRAAQLEALRSDSYGAPYYWAPFIVLGDWRSDSLTEGGVGQEDPGTVVLTDPSKGTAYGAEGRASPAVADPSPAAAAWSRLDPHDFVNGVDETGRFLAPEAGEDPSLHLSDREYRRVRHWSENRDSLLLPIFGVDPEDLRQAGWGVVYGPDVTQDVKEKLEPLVSYRKGQAGSLGQEIDLLAEEDALTFLSQRGVAFGRAVPDKLPYYLLIVGDPAKLPFELQYRVDVQHAVGRLHFTEAEDYGAYAQTVLEAEGAEADGREGVFWGTRIQGDPHSDWMMQGLVDPLAEDLRQWSETDGLYKATGTPDGRKATLLGLLEQPPAFLFTASHGMVFSHDAALREARQGALLCEDWVPREGPPHPGLFLSAEDIPDGTDLRGLIACHFACYSAGCSEHDPFQRGPIGVGKKLHEGAFVSRLSQKLLTRGAQAVLGHVDRAWETSFSWSATGDQSHVFRSLLRQLFFGHRLGHATEAVNSCYAEAAAELHPRLQAPPRRGTPEHRELQRLIKATLDARNYVVIGDPAVRLVGAPRRKLAAARRARRTT